MNRLEYFSWPYFFGRLAFLLSLGFFKLIKANKIAKASIMLITVSLFSLVCGNILLCLYATFEQDRFLSLKK